MGKPGICVEWDNAEKSVIRWDFYDWTWDDFHTAAQHTLALFAEVKNGHHTPSILNLKHSRRIPPGVLPHSRIELDMMEGDDYTVVAEASGLARTITGIFIRLNRKAHGRVFLVDTLDDARAFIARRMKEDSSD